MNSQRLFRDKKDWFEMFWYTNIYFNFLTRKTHNMNTMLRLNSLSLSKICNTIRRKGYYINYRVNKNIIIFYIFFGLHLVLVYIY